MSRITGALVALASLTGSILFGQEPMRSLLGAGVAGLAGWALGMVWETLLKASQGREKENSHEDGAQEEGQDEMKKAA